MCGINLIISTSHKSLFEPLQAMQKVSTFRGPDSQGSFVLEKENYWLGLGVNRLKVVDTDPRSDQPMRSKCGKYILAYNGEVYNYQDLKNRLVGIGYQFTTHSDTEVVLYWLQEFGKSGLADLKGMFSLIFLDLDTSEFFCARDGRGIKPLFYYRTDKLFIISSTIPAIEKSGLANLSLNKEAVEDYLAYRHVIGAHTFYNEVKSVEPGEVLGFNTILNIEKSAISISVFENKKTLKEVLIDSLSLIFEATKTPGLLLSGGVDSTLLLAILDQELGFKGVPTFTLGSGSDKDWARKASNQYSSSHYEIPVDISSLDRIEEFLVGTDQPIADHGAFATWLVAEEAAKNTNVLLSGAGADELFGGYNRHRAYYFYLINYKKSLSASGIIKKAGIERVLPKALNQFINAVDSDPIRTYQNFLQNYGIIKKERKDKLWNQGTPLLDNMGKALDFDKENYLINDVLAITDNASMQHNIETRIPYLYDDISNHSEHLSIGDMMRMKGKGPLKRLLNEYGGNKYSRRGKVGFGLPLGKWLIDKRSYGVWDFMNTDTPIFAYVPRARINELIKQHQRGSADNNMQLWSILVLEKWLKKHN